MYYLQYSNPCEINTKENVKEIKWNRKITNGRKIKEQIYKKNKIMREWEWETKGLGC